MYKFPKNSAKVIIAHSNKVLLIKRRILDPYAPGRWDIPGGGSDHDDEPPVETAARELEEEIGHIIIPQDIELFERELIKKRNREYHRHCFVYNSESQFSPKLSKEHSEHKWMSLTEIEQTNLPEHYKLVCRKILL